MTAASAGVTSAYFIAFQPIGESLRESGSALNKAGDICTEMSRSTPTVEQATELYARLQEAESHGLAALKAFDKLQPPPRIRRWHRIVASALRAEQQALHLMQPTADPDWSLDTLREGLKHYRQAQDLLHLSLSQLTDAALTPPTVKA
jgi:hypothetical protein